MKFIYNSVRSLRSWRQWRVHRRSESNGAAFRDAMLSPGMRRRMQRQSEQPVRRVQTRHPRQGMRGGLFSWILLGSY